MDGSNCLVGIRRSIRSLTDHKSGKHGTDIVLEFDFVLWIRLGGDGEDRAWLIVTGHDSFGVDDLTGVCTILQRRGMCVDGCERSPTKEDEQGDKELHLECWSAADCSNDNQSGSYSKSGVMVIASLW